MSSKNEKEESKDRKKRKISLKAEGRSSSPSVEPTKRLKADVKTKLKVGNLAYKYWKPQEPSVWS